MEAFVKRCGDQVTMFRKQSRDIAEKLAKCQNVDAVIDLLLGKLQAALDTGTDIKIADLKAWWKSVGVDVDEAGVWLQTASAKRAGEPVERPPAPKSGDGRPATG